MHLTAGSLLRVHYKLRVAVKIEIGHGTDAQQEIN